MKYEIICLRVQTHIGYNQMITQLVLYYFCSIAHSKKCWVVSMLS